MKRSFIAAAVGAAALLGGSAANAADNTVKAKAATDVTQQSTDFSSHRPHYGITATMAIVTTARTIEATATLRGRTMAGMAAVWWAVLLRRLWLWRAERKL